MASPTLAAPRRVLVLALVCFGIGLPNTHKQGTGLLQFGLPLAAASSHRKPPAAAAVSASPPPAADPAAAAASTDGGSSNLAPATSQQNPQEQAGDGAPGNGAGGSGAAAGAGLRAAGSGAGSGSGSGEQTAAAAAAAAAGRQECADVAVKATQLELAGTAQIIVTGVVLAAGAGSGHCYPNGTLVPVPDDGSSNTGSSGSSSTPTSYILLGLQCVHKGLVRCRQHDGDGGDCLILVEAPVLPDSQPCALTGAQRYMFFLQPVDPAPGDEQQQPSGSSGSGGGAGSGGGQSQSQQCPGLYYAQFQRAYHTIRRPLGGTGCAFYPAFPPPGDMVQQLNGVCKGSAARCQLDRCDPAVTRSPCANDTAAVCDLKTCAGKYMYFNAIFPDETCYEMYSYVTSGLPVNCYGQRYINNRIREIELQQALANATAAGGRAARGAAGAGGAGGGAGGGGAALLPALQQQQQQQQQQQPQQLVAWSAAAVRRHFGSIDGRADSHEFEGRGGAAAVGARGSKCVMHCDEGFGTASAWRTAQPRLGTWPNAEVGVPRPDVVSAPEPSIFVKEAKLPIIGGVTDTTAIEEYDRIKGTADLNDNGSFTSMSGM
ncbi:hypothetical protein HXX76_002468 [Chlamydomonas incerta]|uniref:Uncharacterized protein n=1 Tax=Chlamydomonas incerta TaxID=51695 RepID=A0A835TER7_CHLIN|nr:hypothetical protein HXX76_002468 [Chlamydomonas incerta]|eukprot:KAG2442382.1 hypothetical protein HXX76_002468 [Chlamydomonas incerta]